MEILAGSLPVRCSSHNSHVSSSSSRARAFASSASASIFSSRARSSTRVCRKVDLARKSRPGGFAGLAIPGRNFHGECWRQIVGAASNGKHNGKAPNSSGGKGGRGGKGKGNPERKDDGKQKGNGWNAGLRIDRTSDSVSNKKQAKPSVWSAEFSSGKSPELRTEKESRGGAGGRGGREGRGGVNVVDEGREVRTQKSSNAAPSIVPASDVRRKNQDVDDALFLRYLSPLLPIEEEKVLQPEVPIFSLHRLPVC